ncbi:hypothetical protein [Burkholderia pseudomultivorans]|uniref:hypothetical protein n=1 Tax=Burkholderia pseudomultivorans TaxID=1207504 RepID=UPI00158933F9|nr:hypothetical protein [Burkholderia pseudomultivorans]
MFIDDAPPARWPRKRKKAHEPQAVVPESVPHATSGMSSFFSPTSDRKRYRRFCHALRGASPFRTPTIGDVAYALANGGGAAATATPAARRVTARDDCLPRQRSGTDNERYRRPAPNRCASAPIHAARPQYGENPDPDIVL